jgi:lysophospholipase L1-like esterase
MSGEERSQVATGQLERVLAERVARTRVGWGAGGFALRDSLAYSPASPPGLRYVSTPHHDDRCAPDPCSLQQYFDVDEVRVVNLARNGRSTVSFRAEGRWDALLEELKPGDYVFVQFGHNDEKAENPAVYADARTGYPRNLSRFVSEARARGAHAVLLTPVARRRFAADGTLQDTHGAYPDAVRAVARSESVPLIDMERRSSAVLREHGEARSRALFLHVDSAAHHPNYPRGVRDDTHFSPAGAELMAREVVEGIRETVPALARHLDPAFETKR